MDKFFVEDEQLYVVVHSKPSRCSNRDVFISIAAKIHDKHHASARITNDLATTRSKCSKCTQFQTYKDVTRELTPIVNYPIAFREWHMDFFHPPPTSDDPKAAILNCIDSTKNYVIAFPAATPDSGIVLYAIKCLLVCYGNISELVLDNASVFRSKEI
ncbi:uncharacterized protein KGF55_005513 [Candida pseudojiufengensis]|uniref:uncharacterized protein n=1 Tax=Candida pseudojiufengensis TaxID=497109 RepID=UPI00222525AD|nr:uncharacterized protein KGF55_005513 [Candida pseudojiufengensis]KAI5959170.1 hypothetical protein KGF55_005513 [Candida pseudojiufengensis]